MSDTPCFNLGGGGGGGGVGGGGWGGGGEGGGAGRERAGGGVAATPMMTARFILSSCTLHSSAILSLSDLSSSLVTVCSVVAKLSLSTHWLSSTRTGLPVASLCVVCVDVLAGDREQERSSVCLSPTEASRLHGDSFKGVVSLTVTCLGHFGLYNPLE